MEKRVVDKEAVVVISTMLMHSVMFGNTFKHSHFGWGCFFIYQYVREIRNAL